MLCGALLSESVCFRLHALCVVFRTGIVYVCVKVCVCDALWGGWGN